MSTTSDTLSLAGATPAHGGSVTTRSAAALRTSWQWLAAVSTGAVECLHDAIYLAHATSRARPRPAHPPSRARSTARRALI